MTASSIASHAAEVHIAGLLVHAAPEAIDTVARAIGALPQAELHGEQACKLVVVIERDSAQGVMSFVDQVRELPGVLNVALVYQHTEDALAMEELLDANHAA